MVNELKDSLRKNLDDKISSPFYGTFVVSWLLWNWKVWYVTFFIDSELLMKSQNILKIDYINSFYLWNSFWNIIYSLGHIIILPVLSSYLIIFWLTKITKIFYVKYLDYDYENNLYKIKKDKQLLEIKQTKLETEEKVLEKEEKVEKIKTKTQEEIWEKEYESFKNSQYFNLFGQLKASIYEYEGKTWDWQRDESGFSRTKQDIISTNLKTFLDTNKIIEIGKDKNNYEIAKLTEKGKYFMKKYIEEK